MSMTRLVFCVFLLICLACNEDQEAIPKGLFDRDEISLELDGKYNLISLLSETSVDLDRDGKSSADILAESNQVDNTSRYYVECKTEETPSALYYQQIIIWVPYPHAISDSNGKFLYNDYSFTNLLGRYMYYPETKEIELLKGDLGLGRIVSVDVEGDNLLVKLTQDYHTSNGWEVLNITGTYRKQD